MLILEVLKSLIEKILVSNRIISRVGRIRFMVGEIIFYVGEEYVY